MNQYATKQMLRDLIDENLQLTDFSKECIRHIFKDEFDGSVAENDFMMTLDGLEEGYGLSLSCMLTNSETRRKEREKRRESKE